MEQFVADLTTVAEWLCSRRGGSSLSRRQQQ